VHCIWVCNIVAHMNFKNSKLIPCFAQMGYFKGKNVFFSKMNEYIKGKNVFSE